MKTQAVVNEAGYSACWRCGCDFLIEKRDTEIPGIHPVICGECGRLVELIRKPTPTPRQNPIAFEFVIDIGEDDTNTGELR